MTARKRRARHLSPRSLTPEEVGCICAHLTQHLDADPLAARDLTFFELGVSCGLMRMEIAALATTDAGLTADLRQIVEQLDILRSWCVPGMNWTDEAGKSFLANADAALATPLARAVLESTKSRG